MEFFISFYAAESIFNCLASYSTASFLKDYSIVVIKTYVSYLELEHSVVIYIVIDYFYKRRR